MRGPFAHEPGYLRLIASTIVGRAHHVDGARAWTWRWKPPTAQAALTDLSDTESSRRSRAPAS